MFKILVIDDDDLVRNVFELALCDNGFDVFAAANGIEGLAVFEIQKPDLVITDVVMPDMDGVEVVSKLKELAPNIPVIVISGGGRSGPDTYLEVCHHLGAVATYTKPIKIVELIDKVNEILGVTD